MKRIFRLLPVICLLLSIKVFAQQQSFIIHDIAVIGAEGLDEKSLILTSGLYPGLKLSADNGHLSTAIKNLWNLDIFEDVDIYASADSPENLIIEVKSSPRLTEVIWKNLSKKEEGVLGDKIKLYKGRRLTPKVRKETKHLVRNYFISKGYTLAEVDLTWNQQANQTTLAIQVEKGPKLKVDKISVSGNDQLDDKKLKKALKPFSKSLGIFRASYSNEKSAEVREALSSLYHENGYADVVITQEEIDVNKSRNVTVKLSIDEGKQYLVRSIRWDGNVKYTNEELAEYSGIRAGMIYNEESIEQSLRFNPKGNDISGLYMDQGYLFFRIRQQVINADDHQVDLLITMSEGK
ncbi:MAG: POTRA domain-containing protein, partial [Cyclobacteriaceae bacterium]